MSEISELTGISEYNLRNWEKRIGFPEPEKSLSGHRKYSDADLMALKRVQEKITQGSKPSELKELYYSTKSSIQSIQDPVHNERKAIQVKKILESLYHFNLSYASKQLASICLSLSPMQALEMVYSIGFKQIGEDWHAKKISITQEHFASQFFRNKLFSFLEIQSSFNAKAKISFATAQGERHEGGILLLAAGLSLSGEKVNYLGTDIPLEDLIESQRRFNVKYLALSYLEGSHFLRDLEQLKKSHIKIILGGPGIIPEETYEPHFYYFNEPLLKTIAQIEKIL